MSTLESSHNVTANPQEETCSQARLSGFQQDLVRGTTRINQCYPWMGPRYQKTHSDTPGRKLQKLVKRHHGYDWKNRSKRKRYGITIKKIKPWCIHNPPIPTIPKQYQKYKIPSNQTWTTHENESRKNVILKDMATPTQESKRGNIHEQHCW